MFSNPENCHTLNLISISNRHTPFNHPIITLLSHDLKQLPILRYNLGTAPAAVTTTFVTHFLTNQVTVSAAAVITNTTRPGPGSSSRSNGHVPDRNNRRVFVTVVVVAVVIPSGQRPVVAGANGKQGLEFAGCFVGLDGR